MSDLTRLSAADLAAKIKSRDVSAVEVAQAHLDRIEAVDERVHAFLHVDRDGALKAAERVDNGEVSGPLAGVPIAVKDVIATKGVPTTAASKILEGWRPPYSATIVERLQAAGTVMLGKTNMDEFAMGSSTEYSAYGPTNNPWDLGRIPGGSGGGSARRSRPTRRRWPSAPTRAARSASRARSRERWAPSRPMGHVPLRPDRVLLVARHPGAVRPHSRGRGAAARGDRGPRPA
jgi:hypothetical protein